MPKKAGLGIFAIPLGPRENSFQFSRTSLIISPNPSVTIAR